MIELSDREKDVLEMLDRGIETKEVAKKYGITMKRIYQIKKKAMWKLNIVNVAREPLLPETDVRVFAYGISGNTRAARTIFRSGITTLKELSEFNGDFREIRNVGEKTAEVLEYLRAKAMDVLGKENDHDTGRKDS